jgi:hypothetical protein
MGYDQPKYTQTPNLLLDEHLPDMGHAETKVVLAIVRQTFGWHKRSDVLSLSQMEELTGLSRQGVLNGMEAAMERGVVERTPAGTSYRYSLVVNEVDHPPHEVVNEVDQGSQRSRPEVVNEVDTQKKEKKTVPKERARAREGDTTPFAPEPPEPSPPVDPDSCPLVRAFTNVTDTQPHYRVKNKLTKVWAAGDVDDVQLFATVLDDDYSGHQNPKMYAGGGFRVLMRQYRQAAERQREQQQRRAERGGRGVAPSSHGSGLTHDEALHYWQDELGEKGMFKDHFRIQKREGKKPLFHPTN